MRSATAYERRVEALILRRYGKSFREIGEYFGVSAGRARQIFQHAERVYKAGRNKDFNALFDEKVNQVREFMKV